MTAEPTKPESDFCYAGFCPSCSRLLAVTVDRPEYAADNAKFIASIVKDGFRLERITVEAARETQWGHVEGCERAPKRKARSKKV